MRNAEIGLILIVAALMQPAAAAANCARSRELCCSCDVNMIVVHATVQDRQGGFVSGLTKDAFTITEDGVKQQIAGFQQ